jgi:NAD(P)-dependent dehydrogenase (short-subunit alcohol dehydrogenase family)
LADTLEFTKEGFEKDFGVNHIGHFALFQALRETLLKSSTTSFNSRVVMVSSIGHRNGEIHFDDINFESRPWERLSAYGQSKTANIYMANYIDRVYGKQGLHAWSLQPGGILSNLVGISEDAKHAMLKNPTAHPFLKTTEQGAATSVWAAISKDLEGKGGKYLESLQEIGVWTGPEEKRADWTDPGFAPFIFDTEKENKLWKLSEELIGGVSLSS